MKYDTNKPRYTVINPVTGNGMEIGQSAINNELIFWLKCGYVVNVARWDGQSFQSYENYLPGDA